MSWKFLTGFSLKVWMYLGVAAGGLVLLLKAIANIKKAAVADIQNEEIDKFEESRDAVVKEQQETTGLSNSDVVDRMRRRHNK